MSWILATPRLSAKMTFMREATPPMETPKRAEAAAAVGKSVTRKPGWEKRLEQSNHDVSANGQPFQRGRGGKSDTFIQFCFDPDTPFGIEKHKQWQG